MAISPATLADVPELNTLVNNAYRGEISKTGWTSESHLLDGARIDEETLRSYFMDQNTLILKNTNDSGQITGCVYLEVKGSKLYVGMFSVSPLLQGQGIGRALLKSAEAYAKENNCAKLVMTVITSRTELIAWYKRRGYAATGEIQPFHHDAKFGVPREPIELLVLEKAIR